jgi:DNA-binding NarL/FixJ family response regulator
VTDLADAMCLSVKTVSTYRTRVLEKMSLERNADLTAYALRHNLLI